MNNNLIPFLFISNDGTLLPLRRKTPKNLNIGKSRFFGKPHVAFKNNEKLYENFFKIDEHNKSLLQIFEKYTFLIRNPSEMINSNNSNKNNKNNNSKNNPILLPQNFTLKNTFSEKIGDNETYTKWQLKYKNKLTKIEFLESKKGNNYTIYIGILKEKKNNSQNNKNNSQKNPQILNSIEKPLFIRKDRNETLQVSDKMKNNNGEYFFLRQRLFDFKYIENYYIVLPNGDIVDGRIVNNPIKKTTQKSEHISNHIKRFISEFEFNLNKDYKLIVQEDKTINKEGTVYNYKSRVSVKYDIYIIPKQNQNQIKNPNQPNTYKINKF